MTRSTRATDTDRLAKRLVRITRDLSRELGTMSFADPVAVVYDPLTYARRCHDAYLRRFARTGIEALFLGMNPGPWGMAQCGVPFGEVGIVREWLGIDERVDRPAIEHPKRPVQGLDCPRSEVSGRRLWGWARDRFETPERFFERFFVWNYCPLAFMEDSGRNRTPDKLPAAEREPLFAACDKTLTKIVRALEPQRIIGVGRFAMDRAKLALGDDIEIATVLHPSPASPIANRGWAEQAEKQLAALGIEP